MHNVRLRMCMHQVDCNTYLGVKQGSWHQLEGSHLRLRREFEYEVEYQDLLGQ